jgi:lysophospholipase L1-like esterase
LSVQVSYKKQTLLGIIGLLILFLSVEAISNVWWITQVNCEFEENEIFQNMDAEKKRQLCVDLYEIKTSGVELIPNQQSDTISINSLGFRGDEFSTQKPHDVHRIFMLGGSTMFGHGSTSDNTTIPGYLQQMFDEKKYDFDVEIINAGIQGADSFTELDLIETKLLDFSPDMIIAYDGWNDLRAQNSVSDVNNNWTSMCDFGKESDFDVVILLQPIAGFGNKPLTNQEMEYSKSGTDYQNVPLIDSLEKYDEYEKNINKLNNCSKNKSFRTVFDNEVSPIYWDQGHVSDKGNNILAQAIFDNISEFLPNKIIESTQNKDELQYEDTKIIENEFRYLVSNYKTPLMFKSIFSFNIIQKEIIKETYDSIFVSQSKIYNDESISIVVEILENEKNNESKLLKIRTINDESGMNIPHVTYFLKILKNDEIILSDFFYTEDDIFVLDVKTNNSDLLEINGERQYDHNAIITSVDPPVKISGPILENNVKYDFKIELRTIYEQSNWVFSLDDFQVQIITK